MFAQRDPAQQSSLMEIPLEAAMNQSISNDDAPILEGTIPSKPNGHAESKQSKTIAVANGSQEAALETSLSSKPAGLKQQSVEPVAVSSKAIIGRVKAKYSYKPQNDDEISFQKGDVIKVVKKDELWWVGYVEPEVIGYFPSNYVTEIDQPERA